MPARSPERTDLDGLGIRALLNIPVFEHGRFVALFYLNDAVPRAWSREQVAFARDVADRTRAAIERRHAESQLAGVERGTGAAHRGSHA